MAESAVWAVPETDEAVASLAEALKEQPDLEVEVLDSFETAQRRLAAEPSPAGVVAALQSVSSRFLEFLVVLDQAPRRIPILALVSSGLMESLPVETGPVLTLADHHSAVQDQVAAVQAMLAAPPRPSTRRLGVAYILPALIGHRSISLELGTTRGVEAYLEIVGGDIWNAYSGELQSMPALEAILYEPIEQAEVKTIHTIPGERQLLLSGVRSIAPSSRRLARGATGQPRQRTDEVRDLGTQEILPLSEQSQSFEALEEEPAPPASAGAAAPETPGARTEDDFVVLLNKGIEASLARDYRTAAKAFREALEVKPGEPRAKFNLQRVLEQLKES